MMIDFLKQCKCVLQNEEQDYNWVLRSFEQKNDPFVAFMPAVIDDLWPIFILECTPANTYRSHKGRSVYIIPIGTHDFWAVPYFERLLLKFYRDDEIKDRADYHGAELEECILLTSEDICNGRLAQPLASCNVIYARISFPDYRETELLFVVDTPENAWTQIVEKYSINTEYIIDSHKGMGDWFECVPLYDAVLNTNLPDGIPAFYFKGKYISHPAPNIYRKVYSVPESNEQQCISEIYQLNSTDIE